jgi:hypothetical protein
MEVTITFEDETNRISKRYVIEEIENSYSPKDVLYEIYQSTKQQIEQKGNENEQCI